MRHDSKMRRGKQIDDKAVEAGLRVHLFLLMGIGLWLEDNYELLSSGSKGTVIVAGTFAVGALAHGIAWHEHVTRTAPSPGLSPTRDLSGELPTPIIRDSPESDIQHLPG